jgi:hypothetical protein
MFWDPRGDVLSGPRTSALGTRASKISVVSTEIETWIYIFFFSFVGDME